MVFDAKLSKRSLHTILWVKLWILWSCVICTSLLNLSRSFTNPILANLFKKMTLLPPRHLWTTWCQQFLDSKISMYKYHLLQPANAFFPSIADLILTSYIYRYVYSTWHGMRLKKQQSEGVWNFPVFWHLLVPIYFQMLPEKKLSDSLSMKRLRFYSPTTSRKSIFLHPSRKKWGFTILLFPYFFTSKNPSFHPLRHLYCVLWHPHSHNW